MKRMEFESNQIPNKMDEKKEKLLEKKAVEDFVRLFSIRPTKMTKSNLINPLLFKSYEKARIELKKKPEASPSCDLFGRT